MTKNKNSLRPSGYEVESGTKSKAGSNASRRLFYNQKSLKQSLFMNRALWAAVFIPWLLDFVTPNLFLTTLVGASIWGLLIASSILHQNAKDNRLRSLLKKATVTLWVLWIASFTGDFLGLFSPQSSNTFYSLNDSNLRSWLVTIHATLLAGASGLVILGSLASLAWITQMKRVQAKSWERRGKVPFKLPSLESLSNLSKSSSLWALIIWGIGFSLAMATLSLTRGASFGALLNDIQILVSFTLWSILFAAFVLQSKIKFLSERRKQWLVIAANGFFWCLLLIHALLKHSISFHEPLKWWSR